MKYHLIFVGRKAKDPLNEAAADYLRRLQRYVTTELDRIRDDSLEAERDRVLTRCKNAAFLVTLDEKGQTLSTAQLAQRIARWQQRGPKRVAFVVGGAHGIHPELKRRAHLCWSLSALTLPHRLAQLILIEQLYRAHTLLRGEPYHRS